MYGFIAIVIVVLTAWMVIKTVIDNKDIEELEDEISLLQNQTHSLDQSRTMLDRRTRQSQKEIRKTKEHQERIRQNTKVLEERLRNKADIEMVKAISTPTAVFNASGFNNLNDVLVAISTGTTYNYGEYQQINCVDVESCKSIMNFTTFNPPLNSAACDGCNPMNGSCNSCCGWVNKPPYPLSGSYDTYIIENWNLLTFIPCANTTYLVEVVIQPFQYALRNPYETITIYAGSQELSYDRGTETLINVPNLKLGGVTVPLQFMYQNSPCINQATGTTGGPGNDYYDCIPTPTYTSTGRFYGSLTIPPQPLNFLERVNYLIPVFTSLGYLSEQGMYVKYWNENTGQSFFMFDTTNFDAENSYIQITAQN